MAQLTCQKLCVGYDGKPVLQDLDFEVFAGDYLCIVGENGSGKSTLMKTILGLQMPISGRILTGDGLRKNEIGYLPQQTVVQKDFPASVRDRSLRMPRALRQPPLLQQRKRNWRRTPWRKCRSRPLPNAATGRSPAASSSGYCSPAPCAPPRKMLLLDEPVSGLDPKVTAEMYALIQKLNYEDGITVVMISHDLSAALQYASHILHIGDTVFFRHQGGLPERVPPGMAERRWG